MVLFLGLIFAGVGALWGIAAVALPIMFLSKKPYDPAEQFKLEKKRREAGYAKRDAEKAAWNKKQAAIANNPRIAALQEEMERKRREIAQLSSKR